MIFYLCTYPRSGNSFVQQFLSRNFSYLPTQFDSNTRISPNWVNKWELKLAPTTPPGWPEGLLWNDFTAIYRPRMLHGVSQNNRRARRFVVPMAYERFTREMRQALAAEPELFFIKSHYLPYPDYMSGERVIHVIRHPGPTIWSYYRFLHDEAMRNRFRSQFPPPTIEAAIEGNVLFGSWAEYHRQYSILSTHLDERFLLLRYEQMLSDPQHALRMLGAFTGLSFVEREEFDFSKYDSKLPGLGSRGQNEGYETFFTQAQLQKLWSELGDIATTLNYGPPDFSLGLPDDQIKRLVEALNYSILAAAATSRQLDEFRKALQKTSAKLERISQAQELGGDPTAWSVPA